MSHVVTIKTEIKDLEAAKLACQRLGGTFLENQQTYKWYGRWVNDYHNEDAAYKQGIDTKDYGKCDHAMSFPNTHRGYEVGLIKQANSYKVIFDFYDHALANHLGGQAAPLFFQAYAAEAAKLEAQRQGHTFTEELLTDGSIKLCINTNPY